MKKIFTVLVLLLGIGFFVLNVYLLLDFFTKEPEVQSGLPPVIIKEEPIVEVKEEETEPEPLLKDPLIVKLEAMTLEEKVAQIFMITPEALTDLDLVTTSGDRTKESLNKMPVGGLIYFSNNLIDPIQTREMIRVTKESALALEMPPLFFAVDEEGGGVARIAKNPSFKVKQYSSMRAIGDTGQTENAYEVGESIGGYLNDLGFNLNFAPSADVLTQPKNQVIGTRAFGSDADRVSKMAIANAKGLLDAGIIPCFKHFPGHGGTLGDTHEGYAYSNQSIEALKALELLPFKEAIGEDMPLIMMAHISLPNVLNSDLPASLSYELTTELLKNEMQFKGVVITDAFNMGAISKAYSSDEASIMALNVGADMILMPKDFKKAYEGVLLAVQRGQVSEERLNDAVLRILSVKEKYISR